MWLMTVVGLILACHVRAQLDQETQDKINAFAAQVLSCRNMVGLGLTIVQNGETVFTNGYGVKDQDLQTPVTSQTLFNIASASKQFTASLLGKVLYDNGISWTSKVRDVLGEDFFFNDGLRSSQITFRDLASHRTGQPRRDFAGYAIDANRQDTAFATRFVEPIRNYRDSYLYNNNMFDLMAYVTEVLSGMPWEEAMRQYIFNPANMTSSTFIHQVDLADPGLAQAYEYYQGGVRYVDNRVNSYWARLGGSGSLVTNAEDMAQWLKLQLGRGSIGETTILPESVVDATRTAVNPMPQSSRDVFRQPIIPFTYARTEYGLGWQIGWYRGYRMIQHTGGLYGYGALVTVLPDMDIAMALALNGADETYYGRRLLHLYIMDLLLGEEPWLNLTTACTFPEPWSRQTDLPDPTMEDSKPRQTKVTQPTSTVKLSRAELEQYTGTYGDFFYGNISIVLDDSQLMLYYGVLDPWLLNPTGQENVFVGTGLNMTWPLALDHVEFSSPDGTPDGSEQVTVDFDGSDPTVFRRELKMEQAPPPPDPNSCDSATS